MPQPAVRVDSETDQDERAAPRSEFALRQSLARLNIELIDQQAEVRALDLVDGIDERPGPVEEDVLVDRQARHFRRDREFFLGNSMPAKRVPEAFAETADARIVHRERRAEGLEHIDDRRLQSVARTA